MPERPTPHPGGVRRRSIFTARLVNSAAEGEQPHVVDDLRQAILAGDEPPGTPIPIDAVARFFAVSPIPVREALKVLLGEGLVEHVPHVGYSVAKLGFEEFRELYEVRRALELSALAHAVRRATESDDAAVRLTHAQMGRAMAADDERAYHAASRRFHRSLIAPAAMQRLLHMYDGAWNMTEPARPMARVGAAGREVFYADHDRMLAAFAARDEAALLVEAQAHYGHLLAAIEGFADDPDTFRPS